MFGPWIGISEDPVTGAAHTVLGPLWAGKLGKDHLQAFQASARGGSMDLAVRSDGRIDLTGRSQVIVRGTMRLP